MRTDHDEVCSPLVRAVENRRSGISLEDGLAVAKTRLPQFRADVLDQRAGLLQALLLHFRRVRREVREPFRGEICADRFHHIHDLNFGVSWPKLLGHALHCLLREWRFIDSQ